MLWSFVPRIGFALAGSDTPESCGASVVEEAQKMMFPDQSSREWSIHGASDVHGSEKD